MAKEIEGDWFDPEVREEVNRESEKRTGVRPFDSKVGTEIAKERKRG